MIFPRASLISICTTLLFFHSTSTTDTTAKCPFERQRGHLKGFGQHARQWLRVESRYDQVSAEEFFDQYVKKSVPVVMRNRIRDWPAVTNWPNLTYLADISGDSMHAADWKNIYDDHEYLRAHSVRRQITMGDYIKRLNIENVYMDTEITAPLLKEMLWPEITNCRYFIDRMKSPSFFFNNGKSNTDIHIDDCETLFFQVAGSRIWLMTPPDDAEFMYAGRENFPHHDGISAINQNRVDMKVFPKLARSTIYAAVVNPGDLIYVPEAWFHNVMAKGNPNLATTIFFNSGYCNNLFHVNRISDYTKICQKHRDLLLPSKINCENKLKPGTTWYEVFYNFSKHNSNYEIKEEMHKEEMEKQVAPLKHRRLTLWDKSKLPPMVLQGEMKSIIDSRLDKAVSILQIGFNFFNPKLSDISSLASHLTDFGVPRSNVFFMLIIPHTIGESGSIGTRRWLEEALEKFESYPIKTIDLVLLEFPPCVPSSPKLQDCDRESVLTKERLDSWTTLEEYKKTGKIHHLGVKDINKFELVELSKAAVERISIVSLRIDPLYRQRRLVKAIKKMGAVVMAHSVTGSGWVRDGLAKENPVFNLTDVLMPIFEDTRSVYNTIYQWALMKRYFVVPNPTDRAIVAEINFDAMVDALPVSMMKNVETVLKNKSN